MAECKSVRYKLSRACSNEEGVGEAIRESGVPRDNLFVVTKVSSLARGGGSGVSNRVSHACALL